MNYGFAPLIFARKQESINNPVIEQPSKRRSGAVQIQGFKIANDRRWNRPH
jgi:hypothetical protein